MNDESNVATIARREPQNGTQNTRATRQVMPRVDVYENADELLMLADMPGAAADSVHVQLESNQLTVEAERFLGDQLGVHYFRAFQMPPMIDPNGISAQLKNGVLHVHLKKAEAAKPRTIPIQT